MAPASVKSKATTELSGGVPFISDADLEAALAKAHVPPSATDAIVEENETARLDGLRSAVSVLAVIALIAQFFTRRIPTEQPASLSAACHGFAAQLRFSSSRLAAAYSASVIAPRSYRDASRSS